MSAATQEGPSARARARPAVRDRPHRRRGPVLHRPRRHRQGAGGPLSDPAARLGALHRPAAGDLRLAAAADGHRRSSARRGSSCSSSRGALLPLSSLCFFSALKYLPLAEATAINYGTPILVDHPRGGVPGRADDAPADRVRARGDRRDVPDRAAGLRRVPGRGAVGAGLRRVLRRVPDPDAHARGRGLARAAVLSGARRHGDDDARCCRGSASATTMPLGRRRASSSWRACSARSATSCSSSRSSARRRRRCRRSRTCSSSSRR